ncbi:hypothetical protein ACYTPF_19090 [Alteromonas sp. HB246098]
MLNRDEINIVIDDLKFLEKTWLQSPSEGDVRRGSAILRRLLVEGILGQTWRALGFEREPKIFCQYIDLSNSPEIGDYASFIHSGGADNRGIICGGTLFFDLKTDYPGDTNIFRKELLGLSTFLQQTCMLVRNKPIKKADIIKYMANTKGGVHLGSSKARTREKELIKKIEARAKHMVIADMEACHYCLLSIGQELLKSDDFKLIISNQKV